VQDILLIPRSQPAKITAVSGAPRGPWPPLRDPQPPRKAPRRGRLSGARTNLQLLCYSQGREGSGSAWCGFRRRLACPGRAAEAWPSLPCPKAPALPSLPVSQLQSQHWSLLVASQGRAPPSLFPRRERRITQRCLTLTPGSGQSPVASPAPGYFYTPLRAGMSKGETLTSPRTPGNQLPSEPAAASRGFPGVSSIPVGSCPPRSGRTAKTLFRVPRLLPATPSAPR